MTSLAVFSEFSWKAIMFQFTIHRDALISSSRSSSSVHPNFRTSGAIWIFSGGPFFGSPVSWNAAASFVTQSSIYLAAYINSCRFHEQAGCWNYEFVCDTCESLDGCLKLLHFVRPVLLFPWTHDGRESHLFYANACKITEKRSMIKTSCLIEPSLSCSFTTITQACNEKAVHFLITSGSDKSTEGSNLPATRKTRLKCQATLHWVLRWNSGFAEPMDKVI